MCKRKFEVRLYNDDNETLYKKEYLKFEKLEHKVTD
jgi:hypothetical protein